MTGRHLEEVAEGVLVATSRTMSTTSTLLVRDGRAVLVDPAWWPDELDGLATTVAARGLVVTAGLSTHAHHDHLLWHPRLGHVPRWASARTAALAREERPGLLDALGDSFDTSLRELVGRVRPLTDDRLPEPFGVDGPDEDLLVVVHDAHAPGHTALWAPERRVLLVGDMLSDREIPLPFDPDDLPAYLVGLDRLAPLVARAEVLVPGHGSPTTRPTERLDADRRYLDAVLAGRGTDDPRLRDPANAPEHARLVRLAADLRGDVGTPAPSPPTAPGRAAPG